jgi:hypothetical protein
MSRLSLVQRISTERRGSSRNLSEYTVSLPSDDQLNVYDSSPNQSSKQSTSSASSAIKYATYRNMIQNGTAFEIIRTKMMNDGISERNIESFFKAASTVETLNTPLPYEEGTLGKSREEGLSAGGIPKPRPVSAIRSNSIRDENTSSGSASPGQSNEKSAFFAALLKVFLFVTKNFLFILLF